MSDFDSRSNRSVKSHHWDDEEDVQLRQLVETHGAQNWPFIASHMPTREAKQCRERWLYHLSPEIKKGKLTDDEWTLVVKLQSELGNRWSAIASRIPGRSPNQIKNHWHSFNRRQANKRKRTNKASSSAPTPKKRVQAPQPRFEAPMPPAFPAILSPQLHAFAPAGLNIVVPQAPVMAQPVLSGPNNKRQREADSAGYNLRTKRARKSSFTPENSSVEESEDFMIPATPTAFIDNAGLEMLVQAMYAVEAPEVFEEFDQH
jgi:hypothetical protein